MSYKVLPIESFEKSAKPLIKKYPSLKKELAELGKSLETNPEQGTRIGKGCFKIRLAIDSKGKGKSGGARVITCVKVTATTVYLLSIYDKSEQEDLPMGTLKELLKEIPE